MVLKQNKMHEARTIEEGLKSKRWWMIVVIANEPMCRLHGCSTLAQANKPRLGFFATILCILFHYLVKGARAPLLDLHCQRRGYNV